MVKAASRFIAILSFAVAVFGSMHINAQTSSGKRVGLVIGNGAYASAPLRNPPNDARDVAAALSGLGFQVKTGVDLDQKGMKRLIDEFGQAIVGAEVALFYYSGHGVQLGKDNYLIPTGADIANSSDVEFEAVDLGRVLAKMEGAQAATSILILDACRDNPLPSATKGGMKGLAVVEKKPSESIIVYATEASETADDGEGRNGVFTEALLRNITRGEDFATILLDVKAEVRKVTGNKQRPASYENLTRKVYLRLSQSGTAELLVHSDPPGAEIYLDGMHAGMAGAVIADLKVGVEVSIEARSGGLVARTSVNLVKGELRELALKLVQPRGHIFLESTRGQNCVVAIDDRLYGSFGAGVFRDLGAGKHEVLVRGDGLYWKGAVDIAEGKTTTVNVALREVGDIEISAPQDAIISMIEGVPLPNSAAFPAKGGAIIADLPVGSYTLEASGQGFRTTRAELEVIRGATVRWEPWRTGGIAIETEPAGLAVSVNGKTIGASPVSAQDLPAGALHIHVAESAEYLGLETVQTVERGKTYRVSYEMRPKPASLYVSVPDGASVRLDGPQFHKEATGPCLFEALPAASYILTAGGGEFESFRLELSLTRGEKRSVIPWSTGSLEVHSDPEGANISMNGHEYGQSPLIIPDLPPGEVDVVCSLPGYELVSHQMSVVAGWRGSYVVPLPKAIDPLEMVLVRGGKFPMGSQSGEFDEKPVHDAIVSDFLMGKYEVTQALYERVMGVNPAFFKGNPDLPIESVNWLDAIAFCNRLSSKMGLSPAYLIAGMDVRMDPKSNGYRLPTEAEWEYAARGGKDGADIKAGVGVSIVANAAWCSLDSGGKPHPVRKKEPNAIGIYDMLGNVFEWCWDWYEPVYSHFSAGIDPIGPINGYYRVSRGGGWNLGPVYLSPSKRNGDNPESGFKNLGFRLARKP